MGFAAVGAQLIGQLGHGRLASEATDRQLRETTAFFGRLSPAMAYPMPYSAPTSTSSEPPTMARPRRRGCSRRPGGLG